MKIKVAKWVIPKKYLKIKKLDELLRERNVHKVVSECPSYNVQTYICNMKLNLLRCLIRIAGLCFMLGLFEKYLESI
jgi:hypothetical protein